MAKIERQWKMAVCSTCHKKEEMGIVGDGVCYKCQKRKRDIEVRKRIIKGGPDLAKKAKLEYLKSILASAEERERIYLRSLYHHYGNKVYMNGELPKKITDIGQAFVVSFLQYEHARDDVAKRRAEIIEYQK